MPYYDKLNIPKEPARPQTDPTLEQLYGEGDQRLNHSFRTIHAKGSFGDGQVPVHILGPEVKKTTEPLVIMLHGVHGCASPEMGNKYGDFARMLSHEGAWCALVETSRSRRDRETFGADRDAWAHAAFSGKTFAQEYEDAIAGTGATFKELGLENVWIFGFSLGGIHAILAAGEDNALSFTPSGIALGGTGSSIRPEAASSLSLPILDTAPPKERLLMSARNMKTERLLSFYGSLDATFSEESCREVVTAAPLPTNRKNFIVIEGSDHSFRTIKGIPTVKTLELMTGVLSPLLFQDQGHVTVMPKSE